MGYFASYLPEKILGLLRTYRNGLTKTELRRKLGAVSQSGIHYALKHLVEKGQIRPLPRLGNYPAVYKLWEE